MATEILKVILHSGGGTATPDRAPESVPHVMVTPGGNEDLPNVPRQAELLEDSAQIQIGALRDRRLRLVVPIELRIEHDESGVTVWSEAFEDYGYGPYLMAAVEDFQKTIAELYRTLKAEHEAIGPDMARLWRDLQKVIRDLS